MEIGLVKELQQLIGLFRRRYIMVSVLLSLPLQMVSQHLLIIRFKIWLSDFSAPHMRHWNQSQDRSLSQYCYMRNCEIRRCFVWPRNCNLSVAVYSDCCFSRSWELYVVVADAGSRGSPCSQHVSEFVIRWCLYVPMKGLMPWWTSRSMKMFHVRIMYAWFAPYNGVFLEETGDNF